MFQIDVQGLDQVRDRLRTVLTQMEQAAPGALETEARQILDASYPLVPYLTGALVRSGEVEGAQQEGRSVVVGLRYGDHGAVPYAAIQHEVTTFDHPGGGEDHYLSKPLFAATEGMLDRLAASIRAAMGG
jgi:hypothetical protein